MLVIQIPFCAYIKVESPLIQTKNVTLLNSDAVISLPSRSKITLVMNNLILEPKKEINSTTMMYQLVNVQKPLSILHCKQQRDSLNYIIGGLDLKGGRMYNVFFSHLEPEPLRNICFGPKCRQQR